MSALMRTAYKDCCSPAAMNAVHWKKECCSLEKGMLFTCSKECCSTATRNAVQLQIRPGPLRCVYSTWFSKLKTLTFEERRVLLEQHLCSYTLWSTDFTLGILAQTQNKHTPANIDD